MAKVSASPVSSQWQKAEIKKCDGISQHFFVKVIAQY